MSSAESDDEFLVCSPPTQTPPVCVSDEESGDVLLARARKSTKRVAEAAAADFVDDLDGDTKRQRIDDESEATNGAFDAYYRVAKIFPGEERVLLKKMDGEGPKQMTAHSRNLCTISPFVKQKVHGTRTNKQYFVDRVVEACMIKPTRAMWKSVLPRGFPDPGRGWKAPKLPAKAQEVPSLPHFHPLTRHASYFSLLPMYGSRVLDQIPDAILCAIVRDCLHDYRFMFLGVSNPLIPAHLWCSPTLLECPSNAPRAKAFVEAKELYMHMTKCYEKRRPVTEAGTQAARDILLEFSLAEKTPAFRLKAPYQFRAHQKELAQSVTFHHFDSMWGQLIFMAKQDPATTLFYFPSENLLELAKTELRATTFQAALMKDMQADDIFEDIHDSEVESIVVMFAERVPDVWWRRFSGTSEKLIFVGDRYHILTVPFGTNYFEGFSYMWSIAADKAKTEHQWEQRPDGSIWQAPVHAAILAGDFPSLLTWPSTAFIIHRGTYDWAFIKYCTRRNVNATPRDEHTAIAPKNDTLVLCCPDAIDRLKKEFLTRDCETQKWRVPKAVIFSYQDLFASKIAGISPDKVDLQDPKRFRQWTLKDKDPREFSLVNLTTPAQCFAGMVNHLVLIIDFFTTRRDLAIALKFTDPRKAKVDLFWAPHIPEARRSFSTLS